MAQQGLDWLVQVPDRPDSLPTRLANIQAHMAYNKPRIEADQIVMSGPTLASHPQNPGDPLAMTGSVSLVRAASAEEVWEILREDPLAKAGVWDVANATVTPFRCAVRKPL